MAEQDTARPAGASPFIFLTTWGFVFMLAGQVGLAQPAKTSAVTSKAVATVVPTGLTTKVSEAEHQVLIREHSRTFDQPFFAKALASKDTKVVIRTLLALGRIGDPAALALVTPMLKDSRYKVSRAAAAAAGWIGDAKAFPALQKAYGATNVVAVKSAVAKAIAAINHQDSLSTITGFYQQARHPLLRAGNAEALGQSIYRQKDPSKVSAKIKKPTWLKLLSQLESDNPLAARGSAFALYMAARKKVGVPTWVLKEVESDIAQTVAAVKQQAKKPAKATKEAEAALDPYAAAYLIKMTSLYGDRHKGFLYPLLALPVDQGVQVETAKALLSAPKGGVQSDKIAQFLADKQLKPAVKASLIDAISKRGKASPVVTASLKSLATAPKGAVDDWSRDRAIAALVKLSPAKTQYKTAMALLDGPRRIAAISALKALPASRALPTLLNISQKGPMAEVKPALEIISGYKRKDVAAKQDGAIAASCKENLAKNDFVVTHHCAKIIQNLRLTHLSPQLKSAYSQITKPQEFEAKVAILNALGSFTGKVEESFLMTAAVDDNAAVRSKAFEIAKKQGMKSVMASRDDTIGTRVTPSTLELADINRALGSLMTFSTAKGNFVIKPDAAAPLTSAYISSLAGANFYKGLTFHRIVPGFVVQGGDPRGDGWGGTDRINPDEFQMRSHARGTVGIATAGKDTGSCQFFVNLAPNTWLDGRYTVFGEVVSGMDVIDRLTPDDVITGSAVGATVAH